MSPSYNDIAPLCGQDDLAMQEAGVELDDEPCRNKVVWLAAWSDRFVLVCNEDACMSEVIEAHDEDHTYDQLPNGPLWTPFKDAWDAFYIDHSAAAMPRHPTADQSTVDEGGP